MTSSTFSTIYAFGDSLSDAGDANLFTTSTIGSLAGLPVLPVSPPYASETYTAIGGGTLTASVFSNGPVWVQDLATALGLPTLAPGALGTTASTLLAVLNAQGGQAAASASLIIGGLEQAQHTTGSNPYLVLTPGAAGGTDFAVGGSVTGATGFNTSAASTLSDLSAQLANFKAEVPAPQTNALYTVWSGSNDLLNLLESASFATLSLSGAAATDVAESVTNDLNMVKNLVSLGAGTVLVLDVPDLGKVPAITQLGTAAVAAATALSQSFNAQLQSALTTTDFGTATVKLEDVAGLIDNAVANPGSYGLTNTTGSVYTGSNTVYNSADLVSTDTATQNQYLFFDGLHPTSTGQTAVATAALGLIACFAAGTAILTPTGPVPVETLRAGDAVTLHNGTAAPLIWVGRRSLDLRRHPRPEQVRPVRLSADAIAPAMPCRDLLLSPDHALFLDGHLIPAKALINGHSIRQLDCDTVTYVHLELARHGVLLAENTPAESYLETGNRAAFEGAETAMTLHPDFAQTLRETQGCAPFAESGPAVEAVRRRILARAAIPTTDAPELRVVHRDGAAWILSRSAIAAHLSPDPRDGRRLGVKIRSLWIDGVTVPADHPALCHGWHAPEADGRWTDGAAMVPAALLRGAQSIGVELVATTVYMAA